MPFIIITFLAAFLIEGLGTAVSVIGLSTLFGANPIIIALAIALDLGKLVVVSLLYTYWTRLNKLMKTYALIAGAVTMIITSGGAAGYLSGAFQTAIVGTQEGSLKVDVLKQQQAKYEERKRQIDEQVAKLDPKTTVTQRLRLMNGFKAEQKDLQDKIAKIDVDLPALQVAQIGTEAHAGPILYIAKAFNVPVEQAVKYVILAIIFVFDPLAVFLIISGNFLLARRREEKAVSAPATHAAPFDEDDIATVPFKEAVVQPEVAQDRAEDLVMHLNPAEYVKKKDGSSAFPIGPILNDKTPEEDQLNSERQVFDFLNGSPEPLYTIMEPTPKVEVPEPTIEELNEVFQAPKEVVEDREIPAVPDLIATPEDTNKWLDEPIGEQLPPPEAYVPQEPVDTSFKPEVVVSWPGMPPVMDTPGEPDEVQFTPEPTVEEPIVEVLPDPPAPQVLQPHEFPPAPPVPEPLLPQVAAAVAMRDEITMDQLKPKMAPLPHASLGDGPIDDTLQFDDNPRGTPLGQHYNNLR